MAKRKKQVTEPLTESHLLGFCAVVHAILDADDAQEANGDYDGTTKMLNDLYYRTGLTEDQFDRFHRIIADANDADSRSPK